MSDAVNRLTLDACLISKEDLRYTLANVPVVEALFHHSGVQIENNVERQTNFDVAVVALGELAPIVAQSEVGRVYRLQGFMNRKSLKSVKLRLHITHISPI